MSRIYLSIACFMVILLAILFFRIWHYIEQCPSKRYALVLVGAVELYIIMDALFMNCFLRKPDSIRLFRTIVFLFYLIYIIVPYTWHLFIQSYMGIIKKKCILLLEMLPLFLLLYIAISSLYTGSLWYIRHDGTYIRGPVFSLFSVMNLFYYAFAFFQTVYILLRDDAKNFKYLLKSTLFSAIPLIGILANTYVIPLYGVYPFQPYCLVITVLLAYFFMMEHQQYQLETLHRNQLSEALDHEKKASKKAREASAVKDTFLANMSHDIRTPMNAILGFANRIARHPEDEELVRNSIEKILASGDILLTIINDVLDLSRIESGKLLLEETPASLTEIADNLKLMLEYSMQKGKIDFEIINHLNSPYVWCDVTKLQQVLVNVLNNAVKFTPEGGTITLRYEQTAPVSGYADYIITVTDTGIGMSEDFLAHAFEAFERERTSTESRTEGTGLGLAIVKKLVQFMNGHVTIQSKQGEGTSISICLPLRITTKEQLPDHTSNSIQTIDFSGQRILLAEDNDLNAEIAIEILKDLGFHVDWVKDGSACIAQLEQAAPEYYQFIFMDIQMPVLNGYDATFKIRHLSDSAKAQIPIFAMTANAFSEDQKKAFDAGMNGFISKPIDVQKIYHALEGNQP